ncbi:hypothetical protein DC522_29880 [Microvirga sp. KLBC 81]|uniref:DUF2399 domain-containing protein n=1 Tax=Microvirga sp. KLBC 81 TaxID=1862707 RepID=UPI000D50D37B|nr:DUF2399 domain-containing protein [Microvirga sp. KLBC 81]PVE20857.1 hypothetical protein DC522_29880 [Microvirga sp. KLBC 81]
MMSDAIRLLAELRKGRRQTVIRAELLVCARCLFLESDKQLPRRLRTALEDLQGNGSIRLPSIRNKEAWDRSTVPPLPHQISLRAVPKERKQRSEAAWTPEFAFASRIQASAKRDALVAINDHFARNRGPWDRMVPYRIRSAQILNDEKAFDRLGLIEGNTICGQAPLSLIGAYNPDLPLVREDAAAASTTVLIVENAHAYDLIASLNRELSVYRSVLWGGGNRVTKRTISALSLRRALSACQANRIEYAGDLDPEGIRIAANLHAELAKEGMALHPASAFYRVMLEMTPFPMATQQQPVGDAIAWLPEELRADSASLFERGHRVAQEVLDVPQVTTALRQRIGDTAAKMTIRQSYPQ